MQKGNLQMYNSKFTKEAFDGNLTVKRGHKIITDAKGHAIGTLSKKAICDLKGKEIAKLGKIEKFPDTEGKKKKSRIYDSESFGELRLTDGILFEGATAIGKVPMRERSAVNIAILLFATLALLATIAFIWMIDLPYSEAPIIEISDRGGSWDAQGTIAVLDDSIAPGSSGEYVFILNNPHNQSLSYDFKIKEFFNGAEVSNFPLEFRIKMNNALLESDKWLSAEELNFNDLIMLADSDQRFALEWRWQFDGGNDVLDTYFGSSNGEYSLVFELTAEVYEEA